MNKLMLVAASAALMAASAAQAGPLAPIANKGSLATPRMPPIAALSAPRLASMAAPQALKPGSRIIASVKTLVSDLPGLPPHPAGAPLRQYWFQYNKNQYPTDLTFWADETRRMTFQNVVMGSFNDVLNPCEGYCGPDDDPVGYVSRLPGVLGNIANRALGLTGGIGNPPLPKFPGEQPPASPSK